MSCTCSYFRILLAPDIFRTVKLFNDGEGNSSLNTVARSQHNIHVKELHLIGFDLGYPLSEKAEFSDNEETIPRYVENLVRELQRFPNLEKLSLKLDYELGSFDKWIGYTTGHVNAETPEEGLEVEDSSAYRSLMPKTYSTLVQYKLPHLKLFEIRRPLRRNFPTFNHTKKLNRLGQFTLSFYGRHSLAGWKAVRSASCPCKWETWTYVF